VFRSESSSDVYDTLIRIDPDHKSTYMKYINKLEH
jgi:hypothetical protein